MHQEERAALRKNHLAEGGHLSAAHAIENGPVSRQDFYRENQRHKESERRDAKRQQDEIIYRAADLRDAVAQELAARGQNFRHAADALARVQHGADLWRQQPRNERQGLAESHAALEISGQPLDARTQ